MQNRDQLHRSFLILIFGLIFGWASQAMDDKVTTTEYSSKQKLWNKINESSDEDIEEADPLITDGTLTTTENSVSTITTTKRSTESEELNLVIPEHPSNILINDVIQKEAQRRKIPITWKEIVAGGAAVSTQIPYGISMAGFGHLALFMMLGSLSLNETEDIFLSVGLAFAPVMLNLLNVFLGAESFIEQAPRCKENTDCCSCSCCPCIGKKGFTKCMLELAYSCPTRAHNSLVDGAFWFNMVASLMIHQKGFVGKAGWAIFIASFTIPTSIGSYFYNNRDPRKNPLYPRSFAQDAALRDLDSIKYVAETQEFEENAALEELDNSIKNHAKVNTDESEQLRTKVIQTISDENRKCTQLWDRSNHYTALVLGGAVQFVGIGLRSLAVYSLTNKACYYYGNSAEAAATLSTWLTTYFATWLTLGAIRNVELSYKIGMYFLNFFQSEQSGYWGQRIPVMLAISGSTFYIVLPTAFSFKREILFNPYGGNCTHEENTTTNNCTGAYYGNMSTGSQYTLSALYVAGTTFTVGVEWFLKPIDIIARWSVKKLAGTLKIRRFQNQLDSLNLVTKLNDYKNKIFHIEDEEEDGPYTFWS
jgi:hypothetical protein